MSERWRKITNWPYEVSDMGRVRRIEGKILKPCYGRHKYLKAWFNYQGKKKGFFVHLLVLQAFVGPRKKRMECNHKNFNKQDNNLSNLEYMTHKENVEHAYRAGRFCIGSRAGRAKLNEKKVSEILDLLDLGQRKAVIALKFNVHRALIWQIEKGVIWQHVERT